MMTDREMALNKADLNAFMQGEYNINSMLPGMQMNKKPSQSSLGHNSAKNSSPLDLREKEKRLQQYGYNKE